MGQPGEQGIDGEMVCSFNFKTQYCSTGIILIFNIIIYMKEND